MSKYSTFRRRMSIDGVTPQESKVNFTKRKERRRFLNSPTLSKVFIDGVETPSIVSENDRILEKQFLFLPDTKVELGWLVEHKEKTYLATNRSDDEIYPQLFCELCNHDFLITTKKEKELIGYNSMGRPIYETSEKKITTPSVVKTNVYSTLGNSTLSLPSGALIVKLPYKKEYLEFIKKNDLYEMNTGIYSITEISREFVIKNEGYLEVTLQRKVE